MSQRIMTKKYIVFDMSKHTPKDTFSGTLHEFDVWFNANSDRMATWCVMEDSKTTKLVYVTILGGLKWVTP